MSDSGVQITDLKGVVSSLKESVEKGNCSEIRQKINEVLTKAQPIQNMITTGSIQESDEALQSLKAELRLATDTILQKCPPNKNNVPKVNIPKTNNTPKVNTPKVNVPKVNTPKVNTPSQTGGRKTRKHKQKRRLRR